MYHKITKNRQKTPKIKVTDKHTLEVNIIVFENNEFVFKSEWNSLMLDTHDTLESLYNVKKEHIIENGFISLVWEY